LAHTSRAALATVTKIIPNHTREGLPVDDSGRFYALPPDILSTAVGSSVPTVSPVQPISRYLMLSWFI
jgi:hypothetical protein